MPSDSRKARNSSKTSSGSQPLGHGRDRCQVGGAPGAGEVPVAQVAEEAMTAPPPSPVLAHRAVALDAHRLRRSSSAPSVGQPERLAVVAQVGAHPVADQGVERRVVELGAHPGVVGPQPRTPGAAAAPGDVGDAVERARRPARSGIRRTRPQPSGSRRRSVRPRSGERAHTAPRAWRRTVEHPLDHGDQAGEGQQARARRRAGPRAGRAHQPGGREHDDQPVGALGDADVGGHAEALGAGLGVGDDAAEDQAGQREGGHVELVALAGVAEHQPTEDGGVAHPVERGVEVGAPAAGAADIRAMMPSTVSEKTKAVMTIVPQKNSCRG